MSGAATFGIAAAVFTVLAVAVIAMFIDENRGNFDNWKDFFK